MPERELLIAAINGVLGDYLAETKNPLAIEMRLHRTEASTPKQKLLVFVHGSSMNRAAWQTARDLGYTPLHLDYNSGLHVSTNARAFDAALEEVVSSWPVPVEAFAITAHSMGGIVTRGACHYAEGAKRAWREKLRAVVFSGRPTTGRRSNAPAMARDDARHHALQRADRWPREDPQRWRDGPSLRLHHRRALAGA